MKKCLFSCLLGVRVIRRSRKAKNGPKPKNFIVAFLGQPVPSSIDGVYWCQCYRFDVLFSYFISQFINVLCWNTYINDNAPITLKMGILLAVEPSYSSVKQWLSARPVVCHHVPLCLETKYDNIKKALGFFWDIFPTWKQIWQNHKGIGIFWGKDEQLHDIKCL